MGDKEFLDQPHGDWLGKDKALAKREATYKDFQIREVQKEIDALTDVKAELIKQRDAILIYIGEYYERERI